MTKQEAKIIQRETQRIIRERWIEGLIRGHGAYTYEEIGAIMGMTTNAVKNSLFRAIRKLRCNKKLYELWKETDL